MTPVTLEEVAKLFGYSRSLIDRVNTGGYLRRDENGVLTLAAACQGLRAYKENEVKLAQERWGDNKLRLARATEIDLRIAEKQKELVPFEEAYATILLVVGGIVSRLDGLPARITRDVKERKRIEEAVDEVRNEMADLVEKHAEALRSGGNDTEAVEEDDA